MKITTIKQFTLFTITALIATLIYNISQNDGAIKTNPSLKKNSKETRGANYIEMQKWQFERLKDPVTNTLPDNIRSSELKFAKNSSFYSNNHFKKKSSESWTSMGPTNQGGRTRSIKADIGNENILMAAAAGGGVWRSEDDGKSWNIVSDPSSILNVVDIEQDTRAGKTNIWYYSTGGYYSSIWMEGNDLSGLLGNGIYKSNDNGLTWEQIESTISNSPNRTVSPFQINWEIELDKSNIEHDEIWIAAFGGVYGSLDGGETWPYEIKGIGKYNEVPLYTSVAVTKEGRVYAALSSGDNNGIYLSNDGFEWENITPDFWPESVQRIVIDNAKNNSDIIYVIAHTPNSGFKGNNNDYSSLWKYNNETKVWKDMSQNLPDFVFPRAGYESQKGYDMYVEVSPVDDNFVILGGINLYRTIDGFESKLDDTDWIGGWDNNNIVEYYSNQHPDQHNMFFLYSEPNVVYSAHDGGISKSNNITAENVEWELLENGYVSSQFWSVAIEPSIAGHPFITGGLQDNGSLIYTGMNAGLEWQFAGYNDGLVTDIAKGGNYFYTSQQYGLLFRLNPLGEWAFLTPTGAEDFLFKTPYVLDALENNVMYLAAGKQLWRNSNLTEIPAWIEEKTDVNWELFSSVSEFGYITAVSSPIAKKDLLFIGTYEGKIYKIDNASDTTSPFINITGSNFPNGYITSIATDPSDADKILVSFSNYNIISLFYTIDGGANWLSVSGNLEENSDGTGAGPSIRDVKILPVSNGNIYFVATSIGLMSSSLLNGDNTVWTLEGAETIGNVIVESIDVREVDGKVVIGTFGKGVYSNNFVTTDISDNNYLIPNEFSLSQNYPNPFNPSTVISYQLSAPSFVELKIFDMLGREITALVNKNQTAGRYDINFDASNLSSGTYIYQIKAGEYTDSKKMLLLK